MRENLNRLPLFKPGLSSNPTVLHDPSAAHECLGMRLGAITAIVGAVLDQEQASLPRGKLYAEAWTAALINLLLIGPLVFSRVRPFIAPGRAGFFRTVVKVGQIVGLHSISYKILHRCMHKIRAMRPIHKFHHKFNCWKSPWSMVRPDRQPVVPTVANAVSPLEFLIAYMSPFAIASALFRPTLDALVAAIVLISGFNLCVHAPTFHDKRWIAGFVHPSTHLHHHKTRSPHYAAPTFAW